jgi:hypothetical protein
MGYLDDSPINVGWLLNDVYELQKRVSLLVFDMNYLIKQLSALDSRVSQYVKEMQDDGQDPQF